MHKHRTVAPSGFDGKPVPFELVTGDMATTSLVVLVPGYGYTVEMPLF